VPNIKPYAQLDMSGALQRGTSHLLRRRNEVVASKNATYNYKIGAFRRRDGYEKVGRTIEHGKDSLGAGVYRYGANNKIVVGINNTTDTNATLRYFDTAEYWTTIISNAAPNTKFQLLNDLDELYVAGMSDNNVYLPLTNVTSSLTATTSHNVYGAPACRFIAEYGGDLYAINCFVNGKYYPDRFYRSSPAIGFITAVQTDQKGLLKQLRVDSVRYLKPGMQVDVYGAASEAKKVSALTIISVDKKTERISFAETSIDILDNDEIWLTGTKGTLSRFWNTDYKTPETADWERVPPGKEARPAFTGWGKNNNRLFLFTKNTFLKFDGANLITVSDTIGCVSHETIQNIGGWTIWLHNTGVYGYNDSQGGQPKLLSRAIEPYIRAINQSNLAFASAGVVGRVYKLAVGELLPLESVTTSTSTSSTSTSSTSSSTSSTSTSSTSTSSTSISTSTTSTSTSISSTSTSTSTTSTSTTSFSTSSTSTSVSTSTSSTTTTTVQSTKKVTRLCYDFDLNAWWTEEHKRNIRVQFNHNMHGYTKPYFTDDTGRLYRDETGNLDDADPIPMEVELGRDTFGTPQKKGYSSVLAEAENARTMSLQYSVDGGPFKTLGQLTDFVNVFPFKQKGQAVEGRDINYKVVHNDSGEPPLFNGLITYHSVTEATPDGSV
jgi:hypothetical protein